MLKNLTNQLLLSKEELAPVEPPVVDTELLDGIDDAGTDAALDVIEEVRESAAASEDVGNAVAAVDELGDLQATLEEICGERTPTKQELALISKRHVAIMKGFDVSVVSYNQESDDPALSAVLTKESLAESAGRITNAIGDAFVKLAEGLGKLWKKFVFFCKSATSQVIQFEKELKSFEGTPKFDKLNLNSATASLSGLGNSKIPAEVIRQCETANGYVYSELYFKLAGYAVNGGTPPEVKLEPFDGLPDEPRFRFEGERVFLVVNPPRIRDNVVDLPSVEALLAWCRAFIVESMNFIRNYEAFKSAAERVYDEIQKGNENEDVDDMMDAGKKILFARSHSCIAAMESWVHYVIRLMTAHHQALMLARKAFV